MVRSILTAWLKWNKCTGLIFRPPFFSYFYLDDYQDSLYKSDRNFGWIFCQCVIIGSLCGLLGIMGRDAFFYSHE